MGDKYGNGRILESLMQQPQQPQMAIASPINDIQLLALLASKRSDVDPRDAVAWAGTLLVESAGQAKAIQQQIRDVLTKG